jgi:predicted  nucleic acid-binding Zn-ribbon protein
LAGITRLERVKENRFGEHQMNIDTKKLAADLTAAQGKIAELEEKLQSLSLQVSTMQSEISAMTSEKPGPAKSA